MLQKTRGFVVCMSCYAYELMSLKNRELYIQTTFLFFKDDTGPQDFMDDFTEAYVKMMMHGYDPNVLKKIVGYNGFT